MAKNSNNRKEKIEFEPPPKKKEPFFKRFVTNSVKQVTRNIGGGRENDTGKIISRPYLNKDQTVNVKKAINPFRALDVAIKTLKYSVARVTDASAKDPRKVGVGAMIVKGLVQVAVLPLELSNKILKNLTDIGINKAAEAVDGFKQRRESRSQSVSQQVETPGKPQNISQQVETPGKPQNISQPQHKTVQEVGHDPAMDAIRRKLTAPHTTTPKPASEHQIPPRHQHTQSHGQGR